MATKSWSTSPVGFTAMSFIIFVMAASFSFRNAASAVLGCRERPWAEAREAEPMANPAAAATNEVTNSFLLFKIRAFESSHLNLIVSPSKLALTLTMDLKLRVMSIAIYLSDPLTPRDIAAESRLKPDPGQTKERWPLPSPIL